jgi:phosphate transport system substrate-binding protein
MLRRLLLAALCTALPIAAAAADVTLAGSDLLRPVLEPLLAGRAMEDGRTIRVNLAGSRIGLEDLRARRADLVVAVFAPDEPLPDKEFQLVPLAYQIVVFAVNRSNPVRSATLAQLGGVFGDREPLNLRQWGDLGGKGMWAERRIALNCVADPDSVGLDLFRNTALTKPQLRTTIVELPNADELVRKLRVDDNCIGLFLRPLPESAGVNVLSVARTPKDVPFGPTPGNVHTGDYPLRLPFYVAVDRERAAELRSTLFFLLGDETAGVLEKAGFVAVPANARTESRRSLGP